jgi:hypothetical protein
VIRLTWLQFRVQGLVGAAALAVVGIVLAITGPSLHELYSTTVLDCHVNGDCSKSISAFLDNDRGLQLTLNVVVEVVPALVGIFWGGPLVAREFETGTYRLVWTQTTRTQWLAVKLAAVGLASIALAGIVSLIVTWWSSPLDTANMTPFSSFDQRGLVPVGYAAFAFVVGVTAGLLIRKTVPAMATTLVAFVSARLAVAHWVRPDLFSALRRLVPDVTLAAAGSSFADAQAPNPRDWVISNQTINASGHVIGTFGSIESGNGLVGVTKNHGVVLGGGYACPNITGMRRPNGPGQFAALVQKCVNQLHIRQVLTYQPIGRYWPLQWCEFAIFIGAAVLLSGWCLWWVHRRIG